MKIEFPIWRLLGMTLPELRQLPPVVTVLFTDGERGDYIRETILISSCFWDLYRIYPQGPVTKACMLTTVLGNKTYNTSSNTELATSIANEVVSYHEALRFKHMNTGVVEENYVNFLEPIHKDVKSQWVDKARLAAYDLVNIETGAFVNPLDWIDFVEVQMDPDVQAIIKSVRDDPSDRNIALQTKRAENLLRTTKSLAHNAVIRAVRSGMFRMNQAVQCLFFRGVTTEVDNALHRFPVLTNYSLGLNNAHDFMCDANTARKAQFNAEAPLEDVVWFARRLELLTTYVERLHIGDCGTKETLDWVVRGRQNDEHGLVSYPGDLTYMLGKIFVDDETGELREITADFAIRHADDYNGKVLKLRSPIKCRHHDAQGVCSTCFGQLSHNVDPFDNLGHLCAVTMTQQTSQLVLSTKHVAASAIALAITLTGVGRRHFEISGEGNGYMVRKDLVGTPMKLYVNRQQAYGMTDIMITSEENISPSRVSKMTNIRIVREQNGIVIDDEFTVAQSKRLASFSMSFIHYLREVGWTNDSNGNFVIDLEGWHGVDPIMLVPDMEYSYADHAAAISTLIESSQENFKKPEYYNPTAVIRELFHLTNSKLKVNLACLEVLVYAAMTPTRDDYGMARNASDPVINVALKTVAGRSMASGLGNQGIAAQLNSAESYFEGNRPDSIFDAVLAPREVSEDIYAAIGHRP